MEYLPLVAVLAVISLVWGALFVRFAGLFGGCLLLLFVASCFGYDFYNTKLGPLPFTADRALLGVLAGFYIAQLLMGYVQHKPLQRADLLFGGFLLILVVSTLTHDFKWRDSQPLARMLFLYLAPAATYWLVRESLSRERQVLALFAFFALFGLYLGITAVAEVKQLYSLVVPRYIVTATYTEWLGRARGPFLNPTTNSAFLCASLFSWAMFWPRVQAVGKGIVIGGMLVSLVGIFLTLTRSCWLGAILGLAIILFCAIPRRLQIPAIVMSMILGIFVLAIGKDNLKSFKRDKDVSEYYMEQSAKLRPVLAKVAWEIFQDYPVFGSGYGQYKRVDINYLRNHETELALEQAKGYVQHNLFLSILVDLGLVGLSLYLATLAIWVWRGWRLWQNPQISLAQRQLGLFTIAIVAQWMVNGMFHDVSLPTNANLLLMFVAGACQGVALVALPTGSRRGLPDAWTQLPRWPAPRASLGGN